MSRRALLPTARLGTALVTGAVLIASTVMGAASAQAATSVADNQATVLRIGGAPVSGATGVPAGRTLTPVQLVTSDPVTSATPSTAISDGTTLQGPVPGVRTKRFTIPAVPAEQVTFRIDGASVATSVPVLQAAFLETDAGRVSGVLFTAGGTSYLVPRGPLAAATRTVAPSTVNPQALGSLITYEYGLLPVGAQPRTGATFEVETSGSTVYASRTSTRNVYDADAVRGNADALAEELVLPRVSVPETEVIATVTLRSGATVAVRGLRYQTNFSYGLGVTTWAFDRAALAAAGATVADVTGVISFGTTDHSLTWQDLGFDLI
ncbi:hypothetical protein [Aquipuribacter sp. MA13-6]|uniref:hypothetical protein n=1 Tax=unclassified Aquipuribacter TaxID=2635084 RepID=UPI003EEBF039